MSGARIVLTVHRDGRIEATQTTSEPVQLIINGLMIDILPPSVKVVTSRVMGMTVCGCTGDIRAMGDHDRRSACRECHHAPHGDPCLTPVLTIVWRPQT